MITLEHKTARLQVLVLLRENLGIIVTFSRWLYLLIHLTTQSPTIGLHTMTRSSLASKKIFSTKLEYLKLLLSIIVLLLLVFLSCELRGDWPTLFE